MTENNKKTKATSKTARTNHIFATKKVHEEKHKHGDTTWKKTPPQKKTATRQPKKKTLFFPVFWPPLPSSKKFEDDFSAANPPKKPTSEKWAKNREQIGKPYFPLYFDESKRKR